MLTAKITSNWRERLVNDKEKKQQGKLTLLPKQSGFFYTNPLDFMSCFSYLELGLPVVHLKLLSSILLFNFYPR